MTTIQDKIQSQIDQGLYPGASLALYDHGKWQNDYFGTIDGHQPTESNLVYDLASVSKVVGVSTVMIKLLKTGHLALDTPLKVYYPAVTNPNVTIRELLTHTSGIDPFIPNRDNLGANDLKTAIDQIKVSDQKMFHYTDINFILLGFLLEEVFEKDLASIFAEQVFNPWQMSETGFGPVLGAVPTISGILDGQVHDPKAKVLGHHCGSAGLFSTLSDLQLFCQHYLEDEFAENLWKNYTNGEKTRSLGWNLDGDWIDHTGYTGPFVMINRKDQQATIFLTNRTFAYDDRPQWITKRRELRDIIEQTMQKKINS
ncbi:serine hydrolase domain-containing protein [Streptococcus moroccensis]|uniref:CubicO group peptidase (Beta-lactamase class C family) n=1 Tax=Streptococcus moroccensis TaxID=1451356 RepID=A0ABT9YSV3_9STRE|nr:serine hydrolase domain-containing protein [Streptococcus moroccensis]MDQ0222962.1 CubicO group peptidase (beta-lactamase class C family) [Streptococcus moroccensis]